MKRLLKGLKMSSHSSKAISSSSSFNATAALNSWYPGGEIIFNSSKLNLFLAGYSHVGCFECVFVPSCRSMPAIYDVVSSVTMTLLSCSLKQGDLRPKRLNINLFGTTDTSLFWLLPSLRLNSFFFLIASSERTRVNSWREILRWNQKLCELFAFSEQFVWITAPFISSKNKRLFTFRKIRLQTYSKADCTGSNFHHKY